eukprot:gene6428-14358_t
MMEVLACIVALTVAGNPNVEHPRLYFSKADLPHLQSKSKGAFMGAVVQQYADALNHQLNYSSGGVMQDVALCSGCGARHELATSLYLAGGPNASQWGELARQLVYNETIAITPATGNWFAGSERNLEQLIASFDVLADLFTQEDAVTAFAVCANFLFSPPEGVQPDMASRLMNPAADRLGALGLIALTFPNQANASQWLEQALFEFKWMLHNGVMADGQWHEPSTRYHGRVLAAFIPFAYALKQAGIMDPFNEIAEFKRFVGYYRLIQTPPDVTMGGCALTPALSDGNWETVWEVTLGWAAGAYAQTDPSYAASNPFKDYSTGN